MSKSCVWKTQGLSPSMDHKHSIIKRKSRASFNKPRPKARISRIGSRLSRFGRGNDNQNNYQRYLPWVSVNDLGARLNMPLDMFTWRHHIPASPPRHLGLGLSSHLDLASTKFRQLQLNTAFGQVLWPSSSRSPRIGQFSQNRQWKGAKMHGSFNSGLHCHDHDGPKKLNSKAMKKISSKHYHPKFCNAPHNTTQFIIEDQLERFGCPYNIENLSSRKTSDIGSGEFINAGIHKLNRSSKYCHQMQPKKESQSGIDVNFLLKDFEEFYELNSTSLEEETSDQ